MIMRAKNALSLYRKVLAQPLSSPFVYSQNMFLPSNKGVSFFPSLVKPILQTACACMCRSVRRRKRRVASATPHGRLVLLSRLYASTDRWARGGTVRVADVRTGTRGFDVRASRQAGV